MQVRSSDRLKQNSVPDKKADKTAKGRWTEEEKNRFNEAVHRFGKGNWKLI